MIYSLKRFIPNKEKEMTRKTIQNSVIYAAVNRLANHPTAEEVYKEVVKEYPSVSRGTVYRNLNRLVREEKIGKPDLPVDPERYDHRHLPHYHVKCEKCGRLFDVDMDRITGLEKQIKNSNGFLFTDYDILFKGICPDCREMFDNGT